MDEQMQDDQLEPIYNSSVPIQGIALVTTQEQWTIKTSGDRGSGRSVLAAWHEKMMMMMIFETKRNKINDAKQNNLNTTITIQLTDFQINTNKNDFLNKLPLVL